MKNLSTFKFVLLTVFVLTISVNGIFAQQVKQESRYVNETFKVSFKLPEGVTKETETPDEVIYKGNPEKFGGNATFNFTGKDEASAAIVSQTLVSDQGLKPIVDGFVAGVKRSAPHLTFEILEQKRIKAGSLDGVKVVFITSDPNSPKIKYRAATYMIPSAAHQRMYLFMVGASDEHFDKWLPIAEASVNSFALIRAEPVKP